MTWHVLLKALADGGRYDQVVKLLTDHERRRPRAHARPAGHVHVGAVEPGLRHDVAVQPDQQRVDVARLGLVGHRRHGRVAARHPGHRPGRRDGQDRSRRRSTRPTCTASAARRGRSAAPSRAAWKKVNGTYVLDVDVPANVKATVAIPNPGGAVNYVGVGAGAPQLVGDQDGRTVFTVGSGATHFSIGSDGPAAASAAPCRRRSRSRSARRRLRRVHAGRRAGLHGEHDRQRDQHRG